MAKTIPQQVRLQDIDDDYRAFVDKFKPKKTTDDCYTPQNVYDVIADYVCAKYHIDEAQIVRPFYPGGDYQRYEYEEDSVVLDNPPFSILSEIVRFYNAHDVKFFLFAPTLTNFGLGTECCHVIAGVCITYENGACVQTSFLTNLDDHVVVADPELYKLVKREDDKNVKAQKKTIPKYEYPDNVLTAAGVNWIVSKGVPLMIDKKDVFPIRALDSQRAAGKSIFGSGFLLSEKAAAEKAAAEKAAAEKAAAEKAAAEKWKLSDRERAIIEALGE